MSVTRAQAAEAGQQLEDDAAAEGWLSAGVDDEDAEGGGGEARQQQQAPGRLHEYVQGSRTTGCCTAGASGGLQHCPLRYSAGG